MHFLEPFTKSRQSVSSMSNDYNFSCSQKSISLSEGSNSEENSLSNVLEDGISLYRSPNNDGFVLPKKHASNKNVKIAVQNLLNSYDYYKSGSVTKAEMAISSSDEEQFLSQLETQLKMHVKASRLIKNKKLTRITIQAKPTAKTASKTPQAQKNYHQQSS